jgi:hypothetical protein
MFNSLMAVDSDLQKKHEHHYWLENMSYFKLFSNMEMG